MEIDLDNLVFSGLEEAQERNAERLEEADKKAQAVVADDDCGDACKVYRRNRQLCRFFYLPLSRDGYKNAFNAPILPVGRRPASLNL